jgi:hypothetical protein
VSECVDTSHLPMEKYRLVEEHKEDGDDFLDSASTSEVRITQQGKPRNYISYAMTLFVSKKIYISLFTRVLSGALLFVGHHWNLDVEQYIHVSIYLSHISLGISYSHKDRRVYP